MESPIVRNWPDNTYASRSNSSGKNARYGSFRVIARDSDLGGKMSSRKPGFPFYLSCYKPAYIQSSPLGPFFTVSIPSDSGGPRRGQSCLLRVRKNPKVAHFKRFLMHLSAPLLPSTCLLARLPRPKRAVGLRSGGHPPRNAGRFPPQSDFILKEIVLRAGHLFER